MKKWIVAIAALLLIAALLTGCGGADREAAQAVAEEFYSRYSAQDFDGMTALMSADLAGTGMQKAEQVERLSAVRAVNGDVLSVLIEKVVLSGDTAAVSARCEYEHGDPVVDTFTMKKTDSGYRIAALDMPSTGVIEAASAAFAQAFEARDVKAIFAMHIPGALGITEEEYEAYFSTFFARFGPLENQIGHEIYPFIYRGGPDLPVVCAEYYTFTEDGKEIEMEILYCAENGQYGIGTVYIDDSKETKDY